MKAYFFPMILCMGISTTESMDKIPENDQRVVIPEKEELEHKAENLENMTAAAYSKTLLELHRNGFVIREESDGEDDDF